MPYDIIYVRYPAIDTDGSFVSIPQGEKPYTIAPGADLILLKKNGSEEVIVDCNTCSVMDPSISFDGKTVYYSLIESPSDNSASWIYKVDLESKDKTPIRLTYDDTTDSRYFSANQGIDFKKFRKIRDMAPIPLPGNKVLFTSNRGSLSALNAGTDEIIKGSVQQMYTITDHDGSLTTKYSNNMKRLETGNLSMVQHPFLLKNGDIIFSSWQNVAQRFGYAMTNIMSVKQDGSNLKQFTEPHEHRKSLEHFITQTTDGSVVTGYYYPSFDYGYGILLSYPELKNKTKFIRNSSNEKYDWSKGKIKVNNVSRREFDRIGLKVLTPHSTAGDEPSPNNSGKYSMPSAAPNNGLLVAYSSGSVNHFHAVCNKTNQCENLKSGIYLIPDSQQKITNPKQLIKIKDDPNFNEIWPKAVVPYSQIYGMAMPPLSLSVSKDSRITSTRPIAIIGTSSMYNRESNGSNDPFQSDSRRELHDGNWTIQGAEAGVFKNSDIYAIRIIGTPAKPFTKPINKYKEKKRWQSITKHLRDKRLDKVIARYGSYHGERWEILGEFPLNYKNVIDEQGNPDSSWAAKIPAETPFLIQALDKNGMTLTSELTWRALKPGEKRTDCGGCHAHSIEPLEYETTFSGMRAPITNVTGTSASSPGLKNGLWDLTTGKIPVLKGEGIQYINKKVLGIEFRRDVEPVLKNRCGSCHNTKNYAGSLVLDGSDGKDVWDTISDKKRPDGKNYVVPQRSKYIRVPQARQSLLVWVAYGERLDGRTNDTRKNDVDYPDYHPVFYITEKEKRTIARWVDLGGPVDFPQTDGMGYTDDNQLPILNLTINRNNSFGREIKIGAYDVHSAINWNSLKVEIELFKDEESTSFFDTILSMNKSNKFALEPTNTDYDHGVISYYLSDSKIKNAKAILIKAEIYDKIGNKNEASEYIKLNEVH